MDQETLLAEQIRDGRRFASALVSNGFPVLATFWAKLDEASKWYFYVVSPIVEKEGARAAYRQMQPVMGKLQEEGFWIDPFEIKAVGPEEPLASAALETQHVSRSLPTRITGARFGNSTVEGAYIYPPIQ